MPHYAGDMDLRSYKPQLDECLQEFIARKLASYDAFGLGAELSLLLGHISPLSAGGKRLRPYLGQLAYATASGNETFQPRLVGLELFHLFCLVQDDVMDRSPLRHGVETIEPWLLKRYAATDHKGDREHDAASQAILVGDLLFSWAVEALALPLELQREFTDMSQEVILGQMLDVQLAGQPSVSPEEIERKTYLKTARYSFIQPLRIGFRLGGGSGAHLAFAEEFGRLLGLAFQIQDDLLDLAGDSAATGKPVGSDRTPTFFTYHTVEEGAVFISQSYEAARRLLADGLVPPDQKRDWDQLITLIADRRG